MVNIPDILKITARVVKNAGITKSNEFKFDDGGGLVDAGLPYHIRYTIDLKEYYLLGETYLPTSKVIIRQRGTTLFGSYSKAKQDNISPTKFYKEVIPTPKNSDYKTGTIQRYFARQASNPKALILEITETKFNEENPHYMKYEIKWKIAGIESKVLEFNQKSVDMLSEFFNQPVEIDPLQFWKPTLNEREKTLKKLKVL